MNAIKNITAAFRFLTVLPIPIIKTDIKSLANSMAWFPLVGAVIGLITGFGFKLLNLFFPESVASILTIVIYIVCTRGLHLDGFMDTIDGFFSHRQRDDILRIMKDPQVGSFAVLGAGVWFMVLFCTIPKLTPMDHVMIQMFSRSGILFLPLLFSYPRESGTGEFFVKNVTVRTFIRAVVLLVVLGVIFYYSGISGVNQFNHIAFYLLYYCAYLSIIFLIAILVGSWANRKIEGITGDILGFTIEFSHLFFILALVFEYNIN